MVQKIVKNERNEWVWIITKLTYRANIDQIYFEEYRKDNNCEVEHQITVIDRKEYTAMFDFINNFCPNWDTPNGDNYGEVEA